MTERITELANQADREGNQYGRIYIDYEKFAELIIEECGEVAYRAFWDNPNTVRGIHIKQKIKQHFGVE